MIFIFKFHIIFSDIVKLLEWFWYENYYITVMEYNEGYTDIFHYIEDNDIIDETTTLDILGKVFKISPHNASLIYEITLHN